MVARKAGLIHEAITREIIGAFYDVFNALGPGFLESVYAAAMERKLRERGLLVEREVWVIVYLDGIPLKRQRIDMLVERLVVVENKAKRKFPFGALDQLDSYLSGTKLEVGLLLNFGRKPEFRRRISSNR